MKFVKMHGTSNDYIVIDARDVSADWRRLAQVMCNRHTGIGSDGILLVTSSSSAQIKMRMFNPDGSEAEMCGNGIRCLAKFVLDRGICSIEDGVLTVETLSGIKTIQATWNGDQVTQVRVDMGYAELNPSRIPVNIEDGTTPTLDYPLTVEGIDLVLAFVSMGNPHAVAFIDTPVEDFPLQRVGPVVENHPIFPQRVNLSIVNTKGKDQVSARVWERGVGETLGCGTGACAIGVASRLKGFTEDYVNVSLPGGIIAVTLTNDYSVVLDGPAEEVFSGEWLDC